MKQILIIFLSSILSFHASLFAQKTIGIEFNLKYMNSDEEVPFANVVLIDQKDTIIKSQTNEFGKFSIVEFKTASDSLKILYSENEFSDKLQDFDFAIVKDSLDYVFEVKIFNNKGEFLNYDEEFDGFQNEKQKQTGIIGNPELSNIIYRGYLNKIEFMCDGQCDSTWLEGKQVKMIYHSQNSVIVIPTLDCPRVITLTFKCLKGSDTLTISVNNFRAVNLPDPTIYFGGFNFTELENLSDSLVFGEQFIYAKYPAEFPLNAVFSIKSIKISINATVYEMKGNRLSEEFIEAFYNAKKKSKIRFKEIIIIGVDKERSIPLNFIHIKTSKKQKFRPAFKRQKYHTICG